MKECQCELRFPKSPQFKKLTNIKLTDCIKEDCIYQDINIFLNSPCLTQKYPNSLRLRLNCKLGVYYVIFASNCMKRLKNKKEKKKKRKEKKNSSISSSRRRRKEKFPSDLYLECHQQSVEELFHLEFLVICIQYVSVYGELTLHFII